MKSQEIQKHIDRAVGTDGILRIPSWWMHKILSDLVLYCEENKGGDTSELKSYVDSQIKALSSSIEDIDGRVEDLESHEMFAIVSELPTEPKDNTIYLVPSPNGEDHNVLTEWVHINGSWEQFGEFKVDVDLSEYAKQSDLDNLTMLRLSDNDKIIKGADWKYRVDYSIPITINPEDTEGIIDYIIETEFFKNTQWVEPPDQIIQIGFLVQIFDDCYTPIFIKVDRRENNHEPVEISNMKSPGFLTLQMVNGRMTYKNNLVEPITLYPIVAMPLIDEAQLPDVFVKKEDFLPLVTIDAKTFEFTGSFGNARQVRIKLTNTNLSFENQVFSTRDNGVYENEEAAVVFFGGRVIDIYLKNPLFDTNLEENITNYDKFLITPGKCRVLITGNNYEAICDGILDSDDYIYVVADKYYKFHLDRTTWAATLVSESEFDDTSDWNANDGQKGHILNRTHYIANYEVFEGGNGEFEYYGREFSFRLNSLESGDWTISDESIQINIGSSQRPIYITITHDLSNNKVIVDGYVMRLYYNIFTQTIDERYIPDTIARREYVDAVQDRYVLKFTVADGTNTGTFTEEAYNELRAAVEEGKVIVVSGGATRNTADSLAMAADYLVIRYATPRIIENGSVTLSIYELKFSATEYTTKVIHKVI